MPIFATVRSLLCKTELSRWKVSMLTFGNAHYPGDKLVGVLSRQVILIHFLLQKPKNLRCTKHNAE